MPKQLKVEGHVTAEEVATARKMSTNPFDQERLLAVEMAQRGGFRIADIAKAIGRGHATIERWLKRFRKGGISELLKREHNARKPQLTAKDVQALKDGLRAGQFKRAKEMKKWLAEERGIGMSLWGVYYWLGKVKAHPKVPRKAHHKQDPDEKEAFKRTFVDKLNDLEIPTGRPIRIWVEDEHRYGLISNTRRCWTLQGHRVVVPYQTKYQWGYIYGACDLVTGDAQFAFLPTVSLLGSQVFLEQVVQTDPKAIHIVLWDQAGFHPKRDEYPLPEQIRLVEFPPYCPELNPIEKLWDGVKRAVSNAIWETLVAIEEKIAEELRPFWESAERVWQLLGDNWLTRGVVTFLKQREALI